MSDQIDNTPEARWRNLREKGIKTTVNLESNELISDKPSWFDEKKFLKAQEAIHKYYIGICYSSFTGLLLVLQLPEGLEPLLSTGNSKDIPSLYKRYLNTILHVNNWYDDDIFNPETKGYKSIRQVRAMHKRVQHIMNVKFDVKDGQGKERVWFNQYDVALTQFAFVGLAMLFPKKSALILASNEDLELLNYYWRVLGFMMGVEDEFNACQFDKYEDIYEFNRLIFEHEYKEKFKLEPCPIGLEMTQGVCLALQFFMPLITFNNLATWWQDCFKFNGYEPQPLTTREKILDCWTRMSFNYLLNYESLLKFSTKLHRKRFAKRLENKDKVYEKLKEQYKDNTKYTFYSERIDYFNKDEVVPAIDADVVGISIQKSDDDHQKKKIVVDNNNQDNNNNDDNNNNNDGQQHKIYDKTTGVCPFGFTTINQNKAQTKQQQAPVGVGITSSA